jgi:hypothetical protein
VTLFYRDSRRAAWSPEPMIVIVDWKDMNNELDNELAFPAFIITNGGDVLHPNHEPQGNLQICRKIWRLL